MSYLSDRAFGAAEQMRDQREPDEYNGPESDADLLATMLSMVYDIERLYEAVEGEMNDPQDMEELDLQLGFVREKLTKMLSDAKG